MCTALLLFYWEGWKALVYRKRKLLMKKNIYLEKGEHKDGLHVVGLHRMGVKNRKDASIVRVRQFVTRNIFITGLDSDVFHFAQCC